MIRWMLSTSASSPISEAVRCISEFFPTGHCRWGQGTSQLAGHELRSRPTHSPLVERHGSEGHRNENHDDTHLPAGNGAGCPDHPPGHPLADQPHSPAKRQTSSLRRLDLQGHRLTAPCFRHHGEAVGDGINSREQGEIWSKFGADPPNQQKSRPGEAAEMSVLD